jgi:diguanylate cyclase (GGDEF)-like protein
MLHEKDISNDSDMPIDDPTSLHQRPNEFLNEEHMVDSYLYGGALVELVRARYDAFTDDLTGMRNSRALKDHLAKVFREYSQEELEDFSLVFIDLDKFSDVNNKKGHLTGDQVLMTVAYLLDRNLGLRSDQDELLARTGGDEFVALIKRSQKSDEEDDKDGVTRSGSEGEDTINRFKERTEQYVEKLANIIGVKSFGISIGYTSYKKGESLEEFIHRADQEMYRVKEDNQNQSGPEQA